MKSSSSGQVGEEQGDREQVTGGRPEAGRTARMQTEPFAKLGTGPFRPAAPLGLAEGPRRLRGPHAGLQCCRGGPGRCRLPTPLPRRPVAPAPPPAALRTCEGISWQLQLEGRPEASLLQREPCGAASLDPAQRQQQEELMGANASAVSTPAEDLLPAGVGGGRRRWPWSLVRSAMPCSPRDTGCVRDPRNKACQQLFSVAPTPTTRVSGVITQTQPLTVP